MKSHKNSKQWNIIFLIYAELPDKATYKNDPDYFGVDVRMAFNELKKTLRSIDLQDNFNVFMIENVVEVIKTGPGPSDASIAGDHTYIKQLVLFDPVKKKNRQKRLTYSKEEDFAQSAPDIAAAFKYLDQKYPADKTLLVTWDHGSAFGIFKKKLKDHPATPPTPVAGPPSDIVGGAAAATPVSLQTAISLTNFNKNITFPVNSGHFQILNQREAGNSGLFTTVRNNLYEKIAFSFEEAKTTSHENISPDFALLSNDNLAKAICNGFGNKYVDVLLMFNCDMQNMHNCYSLHASVKYLVAPEGLISSPGYNYIAISNFIGKNAAVNGAEVATVAVDTFKENYTGKHKDAVDSIAIFAMDLEDYAGKMIIPLKCFIDTIEKMMNSQHSLARRLITTRKKSYAFGLGGSMYYFMVDLINFMEDVNDRIKDDELKKLKELLQAAYNSIAVGSAIGKSVYSDLKGTTECTKHRTPTGLAIYFPLPLPGPMNPLVKDFLIPGAPYSSSLVNEIKWMEFLSKLFATKIPSNKPV